MQIINAPEDPTLVLNGSEYKVADLDESSKYFIDQIHICERVSWLSGQCHIFN